MPISRRKCRWRGLFYKIIFAKKNQSHQIIIDVAFISVILNFNDILIVDFSKIQFNNVMDHD